MTVVFNIVNKSTIVRAKINNCIGNVLLDSGAQVYLISEKFINKHKTHFKKVPILPVNNTIIKTATNDNQIINRQALVSITT